MDGNRATPGAVRAARGGRDACSGYPPGARETDPDLPASRLFRERGNFRLHHPYFFSIVEQMASRPYLGNFELMVLLAVIRLDDAAYGVTILRTLEAGTGREMAIGSVYAALERLQEKGLVSSRLGEPTPERGGRAKRYFRVTPDGVREARSTREALSVLWEGLPQLEGGRA